MRLQCTKKLLDVLPKIPDVPELPPATKSFGNWHVNSYLIFRKKYLLFTDDETLYSFFVPVTKKDLQRVETLFVENLAMNLLFEFPDYPFKFMEQVLIKKSSSKNVLASMTHMKHYLVSKLCYYIIEDEKDWLVLNHFLNQAPIKITNSGDYEQAIRCMEKKLGTTSAHKDSRFG